MLELLIILVAVYLFAIRCRGGHPGMKDLQGWKYAHRGLHGKGIPENSMTAFRAALDHGYGIELDVHLLKDGNLAVIHDSLLVRTTGAEGRIEDLTTEELKNYRLEGTDETIPEFMDVLTLYNGKAPLIIELKPENGNHAALTEAVCKMLETYKGVYCLESFDPRCISWLKKNRPQLIRGVLAYEYGKNDKMKMPGYLKFILTHYLMNFQCVPDFIAYRFSDRNASPSIPLCRKLWKAGAVTWTLKTMEEYNTAVAEGWLPIFEDFEP
jgi:glycerophosphoryl diester phosphodiesterase